MQTLAITNYANKKQPMLERLESFGQNDSLDISDCCCCRLPHPFRGMGAWQMTMKPKKPGNSPGSGPEVVERQRVAKECVAQRVRSWTVQNEMRGVLG